MLTRRATKGLHQLLHLGCSVKLIPYSWNETNQEFLPSSPSGLWVFYLHASIFYVYTASALLKHLVFNDGDEDLPLFPLIISQIWTLALIMITAGFAQLHLYTGEVMQFANLILGHVKKGANHDEVKSHKERRIDEKAEKIFTIHMYIALLLFYTNGPAHILITSQEPCTPVLPSADYLQCKVGVTNKVISILERMNFIGFDLYCIWVFLYVCWFSWAFIFLALGHVATDMMKLNVRLSEMMEGRHAGIGILQTYRRSVLLVKLLNDCFLFFLVAFPQILFLIVAMMVFGTIRLLHVNLLSNVMFPLCASRCLFEALSPLAQAGKVHRESGWALRRWTKVACGRYYNNESRGNKRRLLAVEHRSCKIIQCGSGSFYTFENSIVLCCLNNCSQFTFNLLVTFEDKNKAY